MQTDEIVRLTRKRIADILKVRQGTSVQAAHQPGAERRRAPRWPFKGTVELWPDHGDGRTVTHGTCVNISETGMGLSCDEHQQPGDIMEVAVHLPEMTLCGRAVVRYCAEIRNEFMVGMEFLFE